MEAAVCLDHLPAESSAEEEACLLTFRRCRIQPFGYRLPGKLIERWYRLGTDFTSAAGIAFAPAELDPGGGTIVHGVVVLGAGILGYFVDSEVTRNVYEMIEEGW